MSFIERKIDIQIQLNGDTFDGSNSTLSLSGLRVTASIQTYSGSQSTFASNVQLRICGMRQSDMDKLSTLGYEATKFRQNTIQILAGDDQSGMSIVFTGGITGCYVDYNAQPDVGVEIIAYAGAQQQYQPIAGSSYKGVMDVATMIQGITAQMGLRFINNGVTSKLSNHAVGGTGMVQIWDIVKAAGIFANQSLDGSTITIWPPGGSIDDTTIMISSQTGMVGYPMYANQGIEVVTLFNPTLQVGRWIQVDTSINNLNSTTQLKYGGQNAPQGENGRYYIWTIAHDISSQVANGPWFSRISAGTLETNAHAAN